MPIGKGFNCKIIESDGIEDKRFCPISGIRYSIHNFGGKK